MRSKTQCSAMRHKAIVAHCERCKNQSGRGRRVRSKASICIALRDPNSSTHQAGIRAHEVDDQISHQQIRTFPCNAQWRIADPYLHLPLRGQRRNTFLLKETAPASRLKLQTFVCNYLKQSYAHIIGGVARSCNIATICTE
jgi:hypothetical protein